MQNDTNRLIDHCNQFNKSLHRSTINRASYTVQTANTSSCSTWNCWSHKIKPGVITTASFAFLVSVMTLPGWVFGWRSKKKQVDAEAQRRQQQQPRTFHRRAEGEVNRKRRRRTHNQVRSPAVPYSPRRKYRGSPAPVTREPHRKSRIAVPPMDIPHRPRDRGPGRPPDHPPMMSGGINAPERGYSRRRNRRDDEYIPMDQSRVPRGRSRERRVQPTYDKYHRVVHRESPEQGAGVEPTGERGISQPSPWVVQPKQLAAKYRRNHTAREMDHEPKERVPVELKELRDEYRRSDTGREHRPSRRPSQREAERPRRYVTFTLPRYYTFSFSSRQ